MYHPLTVFVARDGCPVQQRTALLVTKAQVCAAIHQHLHALRVPGLCGVEQRRFVGKVGVVGWRPLRVPSRGKGCEQEEDEEEGASERACVRVGACVRATDSLDQGGDDVVVPIVRGSVQCCVARMVLRLHIRLASPSWSLEKGATQPT